MATLTTTDIALNVWNHDGKWLMTIYEEVSEELDTKNYIPVEATPDRVARYLSISNDDDWWVYQGDQQFSYILWGI